MCKIEEKYGYLIKWLKIKKLDSSFSIKKKKDIDDMIRTVWFYSSVFVNPVFLS